MSKIAGDINKQMMRDAHARAINQPTLELIADILEKHTNGVLAGAREHIERRKSRRKADESLLRQALDALELPGPGIRPARMVAAISAIRARLSDGDNLSPTHYDPTDNEGSEP